MHSKVLHGVSTLSQVQEPGAQRGLPVDLTLAGLQYSMWLDQHSMEEALRFIRSALEACAPAAEKEPGFSDIYPFMLQLSKGSAH